MSAGRLYGSGNTLSYVRFFDDFPVMPITNLWDDTVTSGFADPKSYVVQTNAKVVQRCMLMVTDPGDPDPTWVPNHCGGGRGVGPALDHDRHHESRWRWRVHA